MRHWKRLQVFQRIGPQKGQTRQNNRPQKRFRDVQQLECKVCEPDEDRQGDTQRWQREQRCLDQLPCYCPSGLGDGKRGTDLTKKFVTKIFLLPAQFEKDVPQ